MAVILEKMDSFANIFFGIFESLEHYFLSEYFQNVYVVPSGDR